MNDLVRAWSLLGFALDHVAGECEGCSAEPDQRNLQLVDEDSHRLDNVRYAFFGFEWNETVDVLSGPNRVFDDRSDSLHDVDVHAHCEQGNDDVGEQNRSIHAESVDRLQRHLCC